MKTMLKFQFCSRAGTSAYGAGLPLCIRKVQGSNTALKTDYSDFFVLFSFPAGKAGIIRDISPV